MHPTSQIWTISNKISDWQKIHCHSGTQGVYYGKKANKGGQYDRF